MKEYPLIPLIPLTEILSHIQDTYESFHDWKADFIKSEGLEENSIAFFYVDGQYEEDYNLVIGDAIEEMIGTPENNGLVFIDLEA